MTKSVREKNSLILPDFFNECGCAASNFSAHFDIKKRWARCAKRAATKQRDLLYTYATPGGDFTLKNHAIAKLFCCPERGSFQFTRHITREPLSTDIPRTLPN